MMILMVIPLSSLRCADWLIGTVPRSLGRQNSQPGPESLVLMTCRLAVGALGVVWNKDPIMTQSDLFWARWHIFRGSGLCWNGCGSSDASEGWGSRRRVLSVRRDLGSLFPPPLSPHHTHNIKDYKRAHVSTDACIVYGRWGWLTAIHPWR